MALSVCDISLAMRHHGAIMAAVAGVPGIALAYTEKVRAAWADAGLNNRVVDLADITREGLQAALFAVWRERTTERDLLARIVAERSAQHRITLSMLTDATVSQPRFARETKALADAYLALREVAGSVLTPVARDVLAGALSQTVTVDDLKILKSAFSKLAYIFPREPLYAFLVGYYEVLSTHASDEGIQALIRAEECGYAIEWCRYWRARLYLLLGNVQAARDCLVEALVANPVFSEASDLLSQLKA
jgi:tetratricopeptide (TPR) repeat protein